MGAVTYPHPEVQRFLHKHFVCHRVNEKDTSSETVRVLRAYRLLWSPGFIFLDHQRNELRRVVGYLTPAEFLAELNFALGLARMLHSRFSESHDLFRAAIDANPTGYVAPEALYWAGIAAFRRDGRNKELLKKEWAELLERFPKSTWWTRADVFDVDPLRCSEGGSSPWPKLASGWRANPHWL